MKKKLFSILFALVLVLTMSLVTAAPVAAATITVPGNYSTIQEAIDAAGPDDTIIVSAGTYTQDLVIPDTKTNLELKPATGESVTIKGVQNVPIASWPLAGPNIEILADGVKIHGFTIQGPDYVANYYASGIVLDGLDIEIYNNDFVTTSAANTDELAHAITTYSLTAITEADCSGLSIHDNTFVGSGAIGSEFIYVCPHTGSGSITVDNNQFSGSVFIGATFESGEVSFTNNTINNETVGSGLYGVRFMDSEYGTNGVYDNIVISGNTIQNTDYAIRVGNGSFPNMSVFVATISSNTLTGNGTGVWGRNGSQLVVVNNNITGNTVGVLNANGDTGPPAIDATYNWWGNAGGPGVGGANPVSGDVDYDPWFDSLIVFTSDVSTTMTATYTSTPPPQIGISVDPTSIVFGAVAPGVPSATQTVTVTNTGTVAEDFSASLTDVSTPDVYTTGLTMDGDLVAAWDELNVAVSGTSTPDLILTVPGGTAPGTYTATLVFWAEASP